VLREVFGPDGDKLKGNGRNYTVRSFMISFLFTNCHQMVKSRRMRHIAYTFGQEKSSYSYLGGGGEACGKETT
jgi:hypothetical protein